MNPLLSPNLKALSVVGLWHQPQKSNFVNTVLRLYGIILWVWFTIFNTSQFVEMYFIGKNYQELIANASVTLLYVVVVAKIHLLVFKKEKVKILVDTIQEMETGIMTEGDEAKKRLVEEYSARNWFVSRNFWILMTFSIFGYLVSPKIDSILIGQKETVLNYKMLVLSSWVPYDKYADGYFEFTYALQTFSATIGASYVAIWSTFIAALIIHAIGQFMILQNSLRTLGRNSMEESEVYNEVMSCVKHHIYIIQYVRDLDKLTSPIMFMEFFGCSLILCAIGFEVILEGLSFKFVFTVAYLVVMLIELFIFYWHGNEMILESLEVSNAVWESNWYEFSNRTKKALCLVMLRAQRPLVLNVGNFYELSLGTYLLIIRASYSYVALLRQMLK